MNKRARRKLERQQEEQNEPTKSLTDPWISMRSGLIVMTIVSIGLAAWTTYQASLQVAFAEALKYGLLFGGSIWIVFLVMILINRYVFKRRKKDGG